MLNLTSDKRSRAALVTALALAVPVLFALALPARADTRGDFEKGCKSGGGTVIVDTDAVSCSGKTYTITCNKTATSCKAGPRKVTPVRSTAGPLRGYTTGAKPAPTAVHQPPIVRQSILHLPATRGRRP